MWNIRLFLKIGVKGISGEGGGGESGEENERPCGLGGGGFAESGFIFKGLFTGELFAQCVLEGGKVFGIEEFE